MEIKYVVHSKSGFYAGIETFRGSGLFVQDVEDAKHYNTYKEAEDALKKLESVGYFQIDKVFIKDWPQMEIPLIGSSMEPPEPLK
jgi:hypothetical protein